MYKGILFLALIASGCIQANVEVSKICDQEVITFPGAPTLDPEHHYGPITQAYSFSTGLGKDLITNISLLNGQITKDDNSSFAFLDELTVFVVSPNSNDDLLLWEGKSFNTNTLSIESGNENLADYIDTTKHITVSITASTQQPPTDFWSIRSSLCMSAKTEKILSF